MTDRQAKLVSDKEDRLARRIRNPFSMTIKLVPTESGRYLASLLERRTIQLRLDSFLGAREV